MSPLPFFWVAIIAFGIIMYVLLDGFDLGTGMLTFFIKDDLQRDITVSSILPVWDGNQTWLVFGGAALYGAFPIAFSTVLPILYLPILVMVIALLFRGIAFEFRMKATKNKQVWDACFFFGSLVAAFTQGVMFGSFIVGYQIDGAGESYQWFSPFSLTCGLALVCGYSLLASDRLIIKTEGALQKRFYHISEMLQYAVIIFVVVFSVWSPHLNSFLYDRWYDPGLMPLLALLPFFTAILFFLHAYGLKKQHEKLPFFSSIGIFLMCYIGFTISAYPFIVPRHISFMQAAAPNSTLAFMLFGALVMLPILICYTTYSYYIFRGKITKPLSY